MIRFRTFGTLELEHADGREVRSVLAQPKRLALLAYLAAATPRGFHRRDTLFGLFWPELDIDRARGALNTAVYNLRRSLGAETVVSRGDEEVGLDPERIRCDATDFERSLEADRLQEALELYRGAFLRGFYLPRAPAWERWIERERARLRGRARTAAWALADRAKEKGHVEDAARWARRAFRIAPGDERTLRKLISLLDGAGDRAGALAVYRDFADALEREHGSVPAPETRALIDAVRERDAVPTAAAPDRAAPAAAGPDPRTPGAERRPTGSSRRDPSRESGGRGGRRRFALDARLVVIGLVALLGLIVARLHAPAPDADAPATDDASLTTVAVMPFSVRGDGGHRHLNEGMMDLLSARISGAEGLRAVDPRALLGYLADAGEGAGGERGLAAARRLGARYLVRGTVVGTGSELQLAASLLDVEAADPVARAAVSGTADRLPALADALARRLLVDHGASNAGWLDDDARTMTSSPAALQAYLDGRRALRAGHYEAAEGAFRRAVREDTTFALAYYGWSSAALWTGRSDAADRAREAALRHGRGLSERERLLLEAWGRHWAGAPAEAERLYRRVLERHPYDMEAWYQLGDLLFHWGPFIGRPPAAAREAFERVLRFEPDHASALIHLTRIAGTQGRAAGLDSLASRVLALNPAHEQHVELQALRAFGPGGAGDPVGVRRDAAFLGNTQLRTLIASVAAHTPDLEGAADLARAFIVPEREESWHVFRLQAAALEAGRGRWDAARRELDALEARHPARAAEFRAMLATLPFVSVPSAELRAIRDALPPVDSAMTVGSWIDFLPANGIYAPRARYLLGLLELRLGNDAAAAGHATALERFRAGGATDAAFAAEFAQTLRAALARRQGDPDRALRMLGEPGVPPDSLLATLVSYPKAHARWLRAELLRESGRDREALRWYAGFPSPEAYDIMYAAPAYLRRAETHERLGETTEAAGYFARALEHWTNAGPTVAPLVARARAGLTRLR